MSERVEVAEDTRLEPRLVEDETLAVGCAATTVLITAASTAHVEAVARRIHAGGRRAACPFVHVSADALPTDGARLKEACTSLIDAAGGGSLLVTTVEALPAIVQESLIETLAQVQGASDPPAAIRLIAGTTVILHDRVAAGTFSERLFYRLNVIHLVMPGCLATRRTFGAVMQTCGAGHVAESADGQTQELIRAHVVEPSRGCSNQHTSTRIRRTTLRL